ncbi:MAG TPA: hypothetical protein VHN12_04830, partial [Geobacteraceae bacterium]|nr:hypothetical protein [Geobacteraceae bacterium]
MIPGPAGTVSPRRPTPRRTGRSGQDGVGGTLLSERDISEGFDRLIAANRLFGAELNPTIIKKSGKGAPFLFRKPPSRHSMLTLWRDLFSNRISPESLLVELAGGLHWFNLSDVLLLFGKDRVIYDCQI